MVKQQPQKDSIPQQAVSSAPIPLLQPRGFSATEQPSIAESPQAEIESKLDGVKLGHSLGRINTRPLSHLPIQPKLTIGQVGDPYEQEADRVAAQVVSQIDAPASPAIASTQQQPNAALQQKAVGQPIQRVTEPEEEVQMKPTVQRRSDVGGLPASDHLESSINQSRGGGQAMSDSIRQPMEQAFGADFSNVRVHTDAESDQLSRSINAKAFTTKNDIFFSGGAYQPSDRGGQELLAHELTHVVQQNGGAVQRQINSQEELAEKQPQISDSQINPAPPILMKQSEMGNLGQPLIQRKWNDTEADTLKVWDKPLSGLLWFYDTVTQKLHYKIDESSGTEFSESIISAQGEAYTFDQWLSAGWSGETGEESAVSEDAESSFQGAFRVFKTLNYMEKDKEFYEHYKEGSDDEIVIGVLDTGIIPASAYLSGHLKASYDASSTKSPKKSGAEYLNDIQDLHGTKVAGQAAYGTDKIKLVDVRVQVGQMSGEDNSAEVAKGIEWAVDTQGARVITCSVALDWSKPAIQEVVKKYKNVIFLTSGGNNNTEITKRDIDGDDETEKENALLVGGVTLEGKKHPSRGYGSAVDVMVPSGNANDSERGLQVNVPQAVEASQQVKEVNIRLEKAKQRLLLDQQELSTLESAETPNAQRIKRAKANIKNGEKDVESLQKEIETLKTIMNSKEGVIGGESGVSFGIPVIANIAAKMLIINPALTASEIKQILTEIAVSQQDQVELTGLSKSHGIVDPVKAYAEAAKRKS